MSTRANDIEVIEPLIINNNNSMETSTETKKINLSDLTPEQIKELAALAAEDEKKQKLLKNKHRESYKALVEETVPKALFKLAVVSEMLSNAKTETFKFFEDVLELKNEVYGLKESQRSHTFSCDKGEITIGYRINDGWDDTVSIGIEKVKNFIASLSKDAETSILVDTIFDLLKKDSKGNLKGSRVLELQKMTEKFNDDEFSDGVDIISKAFKPVRSSWFIEAYIINEKGKVNIPLNISSVDFAEGYVFDFFNK